MRLWARGYAVYREVCGGFGGTREDRAKGMCEGNRYSRLIHVTLDVRWIRCVLFIAGLVLRSVEITR